MTCILQFKFVQLSKFYLSIFQSLNRVLKVTWLFLTLAIGIYSVASSKIELSKSRDVYFAIEVCTTF